MNDRFVGMSLNSFSVSRILHAGYLFETAGCKILMDPIFETPFSHNCYAFPEVDFNEKKIAELNVDAVFISHVHDDHLCFKSLNRLQKSTPIYLYARESIYFEMLKQLKFTNVRPLKINETVNVGLHFQVTPRLALDPQIDSILQIKIGQKFNVLNVVDSWVDPQALKEMADVPSWDLVLWPFQTMREMQVLSPTRSNKEKEIPYEWAEVLKHLNARYTVPSSCQFIHEKWSWYNEALFPISYSDFKKWLSETVPASEFLRIDPAQTFVITEHGFQKGSELQMVQLKNNEDIDYQYNPEHQAMPLGDIAEHLPTLSNEERKWILNYCAQDIVLDLKNKLEDLDFYFVDNCVWKLVLHISKNEKIDLYYRLTEDSVLCESETTFASKDENRQNLTELDLLVKWQTEIPIQKLFSALKKGETLTSLYLRINDRIYSDKIEKQLNEVDLLEDPLIRLLFDNKAFRYHQQQLNDLGITFRQ